MAEPPRGAGRLEAEEGGAAELAARALDVASEVAGRAAEISVTAEVGTSALARFAESTIHQSVTEEVRNLTLSITVDGRTAVVSGGGDGWRGSDGLRELAAAGLRAARLRPSDPNWPGLAPPAQVPQVERADRATADASAADRAQLVADFVAAAEGLETAGFCATRGIATGFLNSAGQAATASVTAATIDGIARAPGNGPAPSDGSGRESSTSLGELRAAAAGRTAGRLALAAREDPVDVAPGEYVVVLRPGAVVDVLSWLASGLSTRAHAEGRSFARPGEAQFDSVLTLRCDPLDPRLPTIPFDAQGTPRRAYDLIADGVTGELASDRRDAATFPDVVSNGGSVTQRFTSSAVAPALLLRPGTEAPDELYSGLRQALLITDFWYTRLLDSRRLVVTGLTRNGVFLIEDGMVVRPVRNLRFTQSYAEALGPGHVIGVDGESVLTDADPVPVHTPGIALTSWAVTGGGQG